MCVICRKRGLKMKKHILKILFAFLLCSMLFSTIAIAATVNGATVTDATFSSVVMNVGADETQRNLTWYSQYDAPAEVHYAKSQNGSFPTEYSVSKASSVKATKSGYYSYKATLYNLEENSSYVYRLVVGDTQSDIYSFEVHAFEGEFSFAFVADPQTASSSHGVLWNDTLNKIESNFGGVSFIVSGGDQTNDPTEESNYDYFLTDHLSSLAIATTIGPPHDTSTLYADHFNLPNLSSKYGVSTTSSDYFYKYGNVLFMHLNIENTDSATHIAFMKNTIANNPECTWRIAVLHFSFFSGGSHSTENSVKTLRSALVPKFNELGIDVVLSGHDHVYSRSQLMLTGNTVSSDKVTNGVVNDPKGTLYIAGTTASGSSFRDKTHSSDDAYIAYSNDENRKGIVIFTASDNSLSLKSYFLDGSTPKQFDSFTINKTPEKVIVKDDMLSVTEDGKNYQPLVNAYNYKSAEIKVVGGYWSISTDGGNSFESLGIASTNSSLVLRLNSTKGYWELSENGGASFSSLPISTRFYTVNYVTDSSVEVGGEYDPSHVSVRRFNETAPDAPNLTLPAGSLSEGNLYEWSWVYYLNGAPVSKFTYGECYTAYLSHTATPVSSTMYIGSKNIPEEYTYDWATIWQHVRRLSGEKITLKLNENLAVNTISFTTPINLTLDLNGYSLTSSDSYLINFDVGSTGSDMTVITSKTGGRISLGTGYLFYLRSNQESVVNLTIGSTAHSQLTFSGRYMVYSSGNFKRGATLNLAINNVICTVSNAVLLTNNVNGTDAPPNHYKLTLRDATFKFSGSTSSLVYSTYSASDKSFIDAEGCSFTDTYKTDNSSSRYLIRDDLWYGSASFKGCDLIGMSIGVTDKNVPIKNASSITIGRGCSFKNSATTFTEENPLSFRSSVVNVATGCVLARTNASGSAEVVSSSTAVAITWENPIGYTEYWKKNSTPAYLGASQLTVNGVTYSLRLNDVITRATAAKTYRFTTDEGYLFKFVSERNMWQISTDGGNTYSDLIKGTTPVAPPAPACKVTVDGVSTDYNTTEFSNILSTYSNANYKNKVIKFTLGKNLKYSSASTFLNATGATIDIDLAGHTLTLSSGNKMAFNAEGFTLRIYSSKEGGKLIFDSTADAINVNCAGTIVIGSEEYKNNLTVISKGYLVNMGSPADGSNVNVSFLYSDITSSKCGVLRLNALGAAAITLKAEIKGCTIHGDSGILLYNASDSLSANHNGGVFTTESSITATGTLFDYTSSSVKDFFEHNNFTDRYFGTISFEDCSFDGYVLNGDLIYSDEALSYNDYYSSLKNYDPKKAITVGEGCTFTNFGNTFSGDKTSFSALNVSPAQGTVIAYTDNAVLVLDTSEHQLSDWIYGNGKHWKECLSCNDGVKLNNAACTSESSCDICGHGKVDEDADKLSILVNITLHSNIEINVYIPTINEVVEFTLDGQVYTNLTDLEKVTLSNKQYYKLSVPLGATQAMREISLHVKVATNDGNNIESRTISLDKYSSEILSGSYTDLEKRLIKDMLSYVRSAYTYFATELDKQAVLSACEKIDALIGENYDSTSTPNISSVTAKLERNGLASAALSIGDAPTFVFTPETDENGNPIYAYDKYHFYVNSKECGFDVITLKDGRAAFCLDTSAYMIISNVSYTIDGTNISGEYNLKAYYNFCLSRNDEKLVSFVERLWKYSETAAEYYNSQK